MLTIKNDSDKVVDLGISPKKGRKHVLESKNKVTLRCPKTKHIYEHIINVPNKFALICHGCGEEIYCY